MIRSLLVAYDGSHGARVALQQAVDLARRSEGRITLLTVGRTATDDASLLANGGVDPVALAAEARDDAEETPVAPDADATLSEAVELCRELTVRCLARPAYGDLPLALSRASQFCDLAFVGRDAPAEAASSGRSARSARRIAASAGCPVAITPRQYKPVRSVVAVCPNVRATAATARLASELASLLQLKLEALLISAEQDTGGRVVRELKRYLIDRGHTADVIVRKPPAKDALVAVLGDRRSPLVVVPRSGRYERLLQRDYVSAALEILNATIVVAP